MLRSPADNPAKHEWPWHQLLDYIDAGLVVPVLGSELLWTSIEGRLQHVPTHLAQRLAVRANVPWPEEPGPNPVGKVVERYLSSRTKGRNWPYTALSLLTRELDSTPPPAALTRLAEIPFQLFVSTTTDSYLERAVNDVRFGGGRGTSVPAYGLGSLADLPERRLVDGPTVFPLLGLANPSPDYAVTDEDVLEFVHQFHSTGTPRRLLDTLRRSHILLVGGGFSDWLLRFLVRLARPGRLWASTSSQQTVFIADNVVTEDVRLLEFLEHPLTDIEVFPVARAGNFVEELHRRWKDRQGDRAVSFVSPVPSGVEDVKSGGVFLSYCHEDYESVVRIRDVLDRAGLDVWFDKRDIDAGEEFERTIAGQISRSFFFVPVVSRHTLTGEPKRFFRFEWRAAEARARYASFDVPYVLPLVLDDTPSGDDRVPPFLQRVQWTLAPGGELPSAFIDTLVAAYRKVQRRP